MCGGAKECFYIMYEKCVAQYHPWSNFLKMIAIIITLLLSGGSRPRFCDLSTIPSIYWQQRHFYDHINLWRSISLKSVSYGPEAPVYIKTCWEGCICLLLNGVKMGLSSV